MKACVRQSWCNPALNEVQQALRCADSKHSFNWPQVLMGSWPQVLMGSWPLVLMGSWPRAEVVQDNAHFPHLSVTSLSSHSGCKSPAKNTSKAMLSLIRPSVWFQVPVWLTVSPRANTFFFIAVPCLHWEEKQWNVCSISLGNASSSMS